LDRAAATAAVSALGPVFVAVVAGMAVPPKQWDAEIRIRVARSR
jgi:hypothetical protein